MLTEVDVANPDGVLRAGLYANVTIDVPCQRPGVIVADEALVFNASGLQVATADDGVRHYRKISIYRDFGTQVELRDGWTATRGPAVPTANLEDGQGLIAQSSPDSKDKPGQGNPAGGRPTPPPTTSNVSPSEQIARSE